MSNQESQPASAPRPARMIRLKVAAWMVLIVVAALVLTWFVKSMICAGQLRDQAGESARSLAYAIAAFGNRDVVSRNYKDLQRYSDDLVTRKSVSYVAILDSRERVVVHTNREFLGKRADDLSTPRDVAQKQAAVMDVTRQVGTVLVGVRVP